jgi:peptide/nickel transport system substrate-binding protein
MGENFAKKPIGTGPFMFAEYQPQQFVKLVANKQYFRGAPALDDITYRYIPADSSRDLAFQSGELDMLYGKQDQTWVDRTSKLPGVKVVAMEPAELSELYLNVTVKPLDDIRVRQAIAYAIDRKAIVQFKGPGTSREAVSVIPANYPRNRCQGAAVPVRRSPRRRRCSPKPAIRTASRSRRSTRRSPACRR